MLAQRLNLLVEKTVLALVCLWGNWGIYYLVAVVVLDASLSDLRLFLPVYALQVLGSMALLWRLELVASPTRTTRARPPVVKPLTRRTVAWVLVASVLALAGVGAAQLFATSQTAFVYNLSWALLLPLFMLYALGYPSGPAPAEPAVTDMHEPPGTGLLDLALLFACIAFLAGNLYGTGFHTYDDAYYGFVFSSLLADPAAPVLAADTMFGSDAPYILHPAYRTVGYEVLLALVGLLTGASPLALYYDLMPAVNAATWLLSTFVLLRVIRVPYPGVALAAVMLVTLFWTDAFSLGSSLRFMFWGKSLLFFAAAPLLFIAVARLCEGGGVRAWAMVLLAAAAAQTWSSTGLFLAPFAAGLAVLVFAPLDRRFWRFAALAFVALAPVLLGMAYSLVVLSGTKIVDSGLNAGIMRVQGHAFGGLGAQVAVLLVLCVVPLAARFGGDAALRRTATRLSLVAFFTVMTPFLLEWIALAVGSNFLARRLFYGFPLVVMVGLVASIAVSLVLRGALRDGPGPARATFVSLLLALCVLVAAIDREYLFGDWWQDTQVFRQDFEEARQARALIPDGAFVAAGDVDDALPVFPSPPKFVAVRHYLDYHRWALGEDEYWARQRLYGMLSRKRPLANDTVGSSTRRLLHMADKLGVTTIVFQELWGNRRPPANVEEARAAPDDEQRAFLHSLKKRLKDGGYACRITPSGRTWVCNR